MKKKSLTIRRRATKGSQLEKSRARRGKTRKGNPKHPNPSLLVEPSGRIAGYGSPPARFKKGHPASKLKGSRSLIPNAIRGSVRAVLEEVAASESLTIRQAIMNGLRLGGPRNADRYIRMIAEYVDGKPTDTITLHSKFTDEELQNTKHRLDKKIATLVKTILAKRQRDSGAKPPTP